MAFCDFNLAPEGRIFEQEEAAFLSSSAQVPSLDATTRDSSVWTFKELSLAENGFEPLTIESMAATEVTP